MCLQSAIAMRAKYIFIFGGQVHIAITACVGLLYVLLRCAIYIYEQRVQTVINVTWVHATKCSPVNQK